MTQEYDGPWKEALDEGFDRALSLFFPDVYGAVDWAQDHVALEQELHKGEPASAEGVRRVDKLFRAARKETGDPRYILLECQMSRAPDFGRRMLDYWFRVRERFGQPPICLVIIDDDDSDYSPLPYSEGEMGSEVTLRCAVVNVVRWSRRLGDLEAGPNLFGLIVAAHLETRATRKDDEGRQVAKLRLLRNLVDRRLTAVELSRWARLIDWIMRLPADRNAVVWTELRQGREDVMAFMSYPEQIGHEKGLREGRIEGRIEGERNLLRSVLKAKFGPEAETFNPQIEALTDSSRLNELAALAAVATTLDDLRRHLPPE